MLLPKLRAPQMQRLAGDTSSNSPANHRRLHDLTPLPHVSPSTEVPRWWSSVETWIRFHRSLRHHAAVCQHGQIPPVKFPAHSLRAAGSPLLLGPCLNSCSKLTLCPLVNLKFRAKIWTRTAEFASRRHKLNAASLSSQHSHPSVKSTLYFHSSGTAGREQTAQPLLLTRAQLISCKGTRGERGAEHGEVEEDHAKHRRYSGASKRITKNIIC